MAQDTLNDVLRHLRRLCEVEATRDLGDSELLERFLSCREETAFAILVQRHGPMVLGVCQRVLKDPQAAEDAFQATFLVLVRRSVSIRKRSSLGSWLYGVAQRIALRARARDTAQRSRERRCGNMPRAEVLDELTWQELRSVLDEEIGSLPERYRAPIVLCYFEGKSYDQAARELGWPKSSLASRLLRARGVLRERLRHRGIALSAAALAAGLAEKTAGAVLPALLTINTVRGAMLFAVGKIAATGCLSSQVIVLAEESMKGVVSFKAKVLGVLLTAVVLAGGAGLASHRALREDPQPAPPGRTGHLFAEAKGHHELKANETVAASRREGPLSVGDAEKQPRQASKEAADPLEQTFTYTGRVLGPDGNPMVGAKVLISGLTPSVIEFRQRTASGPEGRFRFTVRRDEFGDKGVVPSWWSPPERHVMIGATADGYGSTCVWATKPEERDHLSLWLPSEELIRGRIIDLEGKPVARVNVSAHIRAAGMAKDYKPLPYDGPMQAGFYNQNVLPYDEKRNSAATDEHGYFTLRGLGRGWLYDLNISGPTIVNAKARLVARRQEPSVTWGTGISMPNRPMPQLPLYGSTFTHTAVPCKPILGAVHEKGSGKPLAGVRIGTPWTREDDPQAQTTTDQEGRYKLIGLPRGIHRLRIDPAPHTPYLATELRVTADQPGIAPVTFDIQLERRPAVTGRVIDRRNGKPVKAWLEYRPLAKNANLKTNPALATAQFANNYQPSAATDKNGRFMLPVLEGPGVLLLKAESTYRPARLEKADQVAGICDAADPELIDCRPLLAWPGDFHGYRLVDVQKGKDANVEIALEPGKARPLVVEFPDGKVHDTTVLGLTPAAQDRGAPYYPGMAAIVALADGEVRRLFLITYHGQFAATALVSGQKAGPVRVKLKPTGAITGRVVDKDGKPIGGVWFQVFFDEGPGRPGVFLHGGSAIRALTPAESRRKTRIDGYLHHDVGVSLAQQTDEKGRFHLTGMLPEVAFDLVARLSGPPDKKGQRFLSAEVKIARPTVKPGETLDLGDLKAIEPRKK